MPASSTLLISLTAADPDGLTFIILLDEYVFCVLLEEVGLMAGNDGNDLADLGIGSGTVKAFDPNLSNLSMMFLYRS